MGAQRRAVGALQPPVQLPRDRELRIAARQRGLELLAERTPCAKDERLDRARGQLENLGDLGVRPPLELANHECCALVEREVAECAADVLTGRRLVVRVDELRAHVVVECHFGRAASRLAEALPTHVVRDRDQPVLRLLGPLATLERAEGVHERRLRDVLGVGLVSHDREGVAVDVPDVLSIEPLEAPVRAWSLRQQRRHVLVDTRATAFLRVSPLTQGNVGTVGVGTETVGVAGSGGTETGSEGVGGSADVAAPTTSFAGTVVAVIAAVTDAGAGFDGPDVGAPGEGEGPVTPGSPSRLAAGCEATTRPRMFGTPAAEARGAGTSDCSLAFPDAPWTGSAAAGPLRGR